MGSQRSFTQTNNNSQLQVTTLERDLADLADELEEERVEGEESRANAIKVRVNVDSKIIIYTYIPLHRHPRQIILCISE